MRCISCLSVCMSVTINLNRAAIDLKEGEGKRNKKV